MNKFVIARIEKGNELVGLRVLTTNFVETKKIVDASLSKIKGEKFENMEVDSKGNVKSLNGALSRYGIINKDKNVVSKNALVILCRTLMGKKKGFVVIDANGNIKFLSEQQAVKEAKKMISASKSDSETGIANGKLVEKDDKEFISAIRGDYVLIENVGILEDNSGGKVWDLSKSGQGYKLSNHIEAIKKGMETTGKINKEYSLQILSMFQCEELNKAIDKEDLAETCKILAKKYDELKDIIVNCELEKEITDFVMNVAKDGKANKDFFAQCKKAVVEKRTLSKLFE